MPLEPHVSDVLYPLLGRLHHMDPVLTAQEEAIASEDGASAADADAPARSALGDAATRNAFLEAVNDGGTGALHRVWAVEEPSSSQPSRG